MNKLSGMEATRVLIGPSYLREIESIRWESATVRYLIKNKPDQRHKPEHYIYYDNGSINECVRGKHVDDELSKIIIDLNNDINCYFLFERQRTSYSKGAFLAPIDIVSYARYAWSIIKNYEPDLVIFHNFPHELFTYVLKRIALYLNIQIMMVHFSVLPWRMCISQFLTDGSIHKLRISDRYGDAEKQSVMKYMARLQSSHEKAIPNTDLKLLSPKGSALYVGEELSSLMRGSLVKNVIRILQKLSLYRSFKKNITHKIRQPYVAFFLHYQPEESTIPRAGIFAQQLNAVLKLRSLLPNEISILVKENRATFRVPVTLAMGVRSAGFYDAITSLPATYLVPPDQDTFNLIDNSLAVVTLTGSVGIEALCRGKKVIIFGDATYKDFSGVTRLDLEEPHSCDLSWVGDSATHDPILTQKDLLEELLFSFGVGSENNQVNFKFQQDAAVEAFEFIANNMDSIKKWRREIGQSVK